MSNLFKIKVAWPVMRISSLKQSADEENEVQENVITSLSRNSKF